MGAGASVERHDGAPPGEDQIAARMGAEGLSPHGWGNGPGDTYCGCRKPVSPGQMLWASAVPCPVPGEPVSGRPDVR